MRSFSLFILFFVISAIASEEPAVVDRAFCLKRGPIEPTCEHPIPPALDNISLSDLSTDDKGYRILWVWASIYVPEDTALMYVFYSSNDKKPWAERIHMHWIDRTKSISQALFEKAKGVLGVIYNSESESALHDIQGVGFVAEPQSLNRWLVRLKVAPGEYGVEIQDFAGNVISGGEKKTIRIVE